jgi:hypothetical protein
MRIQILKRTGEWIEFSSSFGTATACLEAQDEVGELLDVELAIPHVLIWDIDIRLTDATAVSVCHDQNITTLIGRLEQIDADSVWIIRLGADLLMVEVGCEGMAVTLGAMLEIKTNALHLFPYCF